MNALPVALLLAIGLAGAAPPFDGDERGRLEAGKVLVTTRPPTDGTGFSVRGVALVDAPPAQVWPALRDCGKFDRFMPRARDSVEKRVDEHTSLCRIRMNLPFPFRDLESTARSVWKTLPGGGFQRQWSLVEGDYDRSEGSWTVLPWDEGRRSLVIYEQDAAPRTTLPDVLLRAGQKELLPGAFHALRRRVSDLSDVASGAD